MGPVRRRKICGERLSLSAHLGDLGDHGFGFHLATAVVNQNPCTCLSKRQGASAANPAGSSGNQSRFA
jgi:hypothetical protein